MVSCQQQFEVAFSSNRFHVNQQSVEFAIDFESLKADMYAAKAEINPKPTRQSAPIGSNTGRTSCAIFAEPTFNGRVMRRIAPRRSNAWEACGSALVW